MDQQMNARERAHAMLLLAAYLEEIAAGKYVAALHLHPDTAALAILALTEWALNEKHRNGRTDDEL